MTNSRVEISLAHRKELDANGTLDNMTSVQKAEYWIEYNRNTFGLEPSNTSLIILASMKETELLLTKLE